MIIKRKVEQIAKIMYKNSFRDGKLDQTRISKILKQVSKSKMQGITKILKVYKRRIEAQVAKEKVVVESAMKLDSKMEKQIMSKTDAIKLEYKINPLIIFGAKITIGDWEYDQSLDNKLKQVLQ